MPRRAISLALIAAVACPAAGGAQSTPPTPGPAKDFAVPARHDLTLPNGMQVTLVPYGTVPLATVSLNLRTGAIDESADQVWLSRLMSQMWLQGTTTRSSTAIAEAAGGMGGEVTVQPGVDEIDVGGEVLGDSAAAFARLVADVARNASFPDSEFARVRGDLARSLAIAMSRPGNQVSERFDPLVYPDHPYGRPFPTAAALGAYTAQQTRDFYRTNVGAARAHLYVVGRFNVAAVERAARDALGDGAAGAPPKVHPPTPHTARVVVLIDRPGAVQSTLRLGLPVPDPTRADWIELQVTDALLAGSFASRISRT